MVQGFSLVGLPVDRHETTELQSLPRRLHTGDPILHTYKGFPPLGACLLRHDLATLVAHQRGLGQAPYSLLLAPTKDDGFCIAAMRNLAHPLGCRLHGRSLRCLECHTADARVDKGYGAICGAEKAWTMSMCKLHHHMNNQNETYWIQVKSPPKGWSNTCFLRIWQNLQVFANI